MNIKDAKNYIKDSVRIYLKKDEEGHFRISQNTSAVQNDENA